MARKIQALPPGVEYRGPYQYRVQIRRAGVIRSKTFETADQAVRWRNQIIGKISGDEYVDRSKERRTTLAELLQRYLKDVTPTKRGALKEVYRINAWLQEEFVKLPVVSIDAGEFTVYRDRRRAEGRAASTISNALNLMSAVYRTARAEWGYKIDNPLTGIKRPPPEPPREVYLQQEMDSVLLGSCRNGPPWLPVMVTLAINTAMRQGEIRKLRWEWIDLENGLITLPYRVAGQPGRPRKEKVTKTGKGRSVPLLDDAVAVLRDWAGEEPSLTGLVFLSSKGDGEIRQDVVTKAYGKAAKAASRSDLTFHDLRHVASTRLAKHHRDALHLAKMTGHSDLRSLSRYYNPDPIENAAEIRASARAAKMEN